MTLIIEDRFRAKVPCTDACDLRWREHRTFVMFRHGAAEKSIPIIDDETDEPRGGWLTEAIEWCEAQHAEGDAW